jgi:hypothetical protein
MSINPTATLQFTDYEVTDDGIRLHFVSPDPGAGNNSDYYVTLTDVELAGAQTQAALIALVQGRVNRKLNAAGIAAKLALFVGQSLVLGSVVGADAAPGPGPMLSVLVTPWSAGSLGAELAALSLAAPVSTAWATANLARVVPFVVPKPALVRKMFWANGATVAGNVDVGIYDESGSRVVSMGSVAQAGVSVLQEVDIADVTLGVGRYYMALAASSAAATFLASAPPLQLCKGMGCAQQAAAFPLPASATPAPFSAAVLPYFGLSLRSLVV